MKAVILFAVFSLALFSCSDDPVDPGTTETGNLEGDVVVYDAHLQRVADASGVLVRFKDTDGKVFEAITNAEGVWSMPLPFGVYMLDTMMHPTCIQLQSGVRASNHPKAPVDWMGKGTRREIYGTVFCPPVIDSVSEILSSTVQIDTTFTPAKNENGHTTPAKYHLHLALTCDVRKPEQTFSFWIQSGFTAALVTNSNKVITCDPRYSQTSSTGGVLTINMSADLKDFTELENAYVKVITKIEVEQWYDVRHAFLTDNWQSVSVPFYNHESTENIPLP